MDDPFTEAVLSRCRAADLVGYWGLIATAAGDPVARQGTLERVSIRNLAPHPAATAEGPAQVMERIEALSVKFGDDVRALSSALDAEPSKNYWLEGARSAVRKVLCPVRPDRSLPSWSLEAECRRYQSLFEADAAVARLAGRPLRNDVLTQDDLNHVVAVFPALLRAMQHQRFAIRPEAFGSFLGQTSTIDPCWLAYLIVLSRRAEVPVEAWRSAYLPVWQAVERPEETIPAIYTLLSPTWNVVAVFFPLMDRGVGT